MLFQSGVSEENFRGNWKDKSSYLCLDQLFYSAVATFRYLQELLQSFKSQFPELWKEATDKAEKLGLDESALPIEFAKRFGV